MSANRADFVSNLFSRVRPPASTAKTTPAAQFAAYENAKVDPDLLLATTKLLAAIYRTF